MMRQTSPTAAPAPGAAVAAICVLIPVWKDQAGLDRTLATLAGDPLVFDIVVVDDGSPVPVTCPDRAGPHPVTLRRLPENRGIEHALNAGLELILERGHAYVARLDCGDIPLEGRLARQAAYLDAHPDVGILGTWARCVDDAGAISSPCGCRRTMPASCASSAIPRACCTRR